jgi:hypothetical protein
VRRAKADSVQRRPGPGYHSLQSQMCVCVCVSLRGEGGRACVRSGREPKGFGNLSTKRTEISFMKPLYEED